MDKDREEFTIKQLAQLSGVSVRTLQYYDEIGLLKPAYRGINGYRYYEKKQLFILQQVLFFKEFDIDLKTVRKILLSSEFDKIRILVSHKKVLQNEMLRLKKLIKTIDKTIKHLKEEVNMSDQEIFYGFSKEQQKKYENELVEKLGDKVKKSIAESRENVKNWTKKDWEKSKKEFDAICKELVKMIEKNFQVNSSEVQGIIQSHFQWLKKFWTPTKTSYAGHADFIVQSELCKTYAAYHPKLPEFLSEAIKIYAKKNLQ